VLNPKVKFHDAPACAWVIGVQRTCALAGVLKAQYLCERVFTACAGVALAAIMSTAMCTALATLKARTLSAQGYSPSLDYRVRDQDVAAFSALSAAYSGTSTTAVVAAIQLVGNGVPDFAKVRAASRG
jgi:hypothetical protein